MAKVTALIPCAGQGKRMGGPVSKPYLEVNGRPLLAYTLEKFEKHPLVDEVVLIVHQDAVCYCQKEVVDKYGFSKVKEITGGGRERQDSVAAGLSLLKEDVKWVIVHDGVRPLITEEIITKAIETAFELGSAVVAVPVKDTIKVSNPDFTVKETPERCFLWQVQTPQVFDRDVLVRAYEEATRNGWQGTDDSSLVERLGVKVHLVEGEYSNLKITTPEDLRYFKEMLR